jgi:hypothetical protein
VQDKEWAFAILQANDFSLKSILEESIKKDSSITFFSIVFQEKISNSF